MLHQDGSASDDGSVNDGGGGVVRLCSLRRMHKDLPRQNNSIPRRSLRGDVNEIGGGSHLERSLDSNGREFVEVARTIE